MREVVSGLGFLEGVRWHDGRVFASSVLTGAVVAIADDGATETVAEIEGHAGGLGWDPEGRLLVVSMSSRQLLRQDGIAVNDFADLRHLVTGGLNDMTVDGDGRAYISTLAADPFETPIEEYASRPSHVVFVDQDGSAGVAASGLRFPNGLAISSDRSTLFVAETFGGRVSAFAQASDGSLTERRDWFVFEPRPLDQQRGGVWSEKPSPDGIAIDSDDGIWISDPGGSGVVRVVEGQGITDVISTGELAVFAVALGGPDGRTLYMCAGPPTGNGPRNPDVAFRVLAERVAVAA